MPDQFLDKNGVRTLWNKTKQLVENSKGSSEAHYIRIRDNTNFSNTMWRLVCVFPVNNAINKCSVTIDGKMGGWTNDNSYLIHAIIMNRDIAAYGITFGKTDATNDFSRLELYKNNIDNKAYLYMKVKGYFGFDFTLRTSGEDANDINGISIRWDNSSWTTTKPSGILQWDGTQTTNDKVSTDTSGYRFTSYFTIGSMQIEWGHTNSRAGTSSVKTTVSFSKSFSGRPIVLLQSYNKTDAPDEAENVTSQTQYRNSQSVRSVSSTNFSFDSGNGEAHGYSWIAIGRRS